MGVFGWVFMSALLSGGCALSTDYVDIGYASPYQSVAPVAGAEAVNLSVDMTDARPEKDKERVSCKKNGYGMEMAPIVAETDVAAVVTDAIATELRTRGFKTDGGNVRIAIELNKFYSDFKIGFWSGSAVSEVTFHVTVKKSGGDISYAKSVRGEFTKKGVQIASGANAKMSLEGALKDAVSKLMNDSAFTTALVQAET
jgi:uncharacterized lipoprotein YajG